MNSLYIITETVFPELFCPCVSLQAVRNTAKKESKRRIFFNFCFLMGMDRQIVDTKINQMCGFLVVFYGKKIFLQKLWLKNV